MRRKKASAPANPEQKRHILQTVLFLCCCLIVLGAATAGGFFLYQYATSSETFSIRHINVHGLTHLTRDDIAKVQPLATGANIFSVNIADVERNLRKNPWVQTVSVKRKLPDTFEINISERTPLFWVRQNDHLCYADADGLPIEAIKMDKFTALPLLEIAEDGSGISDKAGLVLAESQKLRFPKGFGTVTRITLGLEDGIEVTIGNSRLILHVQHSDWKTNFKKVQAVIDDLKTRKELEGIKQIWVFNGVAWAERAGEGQT